MAARSSCCSTHSPASHRVVNGWTTCFPSALTLRGSSAESPSTTPPLPPVLLCHFKKIPCRRFTKILKANRGQLQPLKTGGSGGIEGISGVVSLHLRFLTSNEAQRERSEIPQQGTTFSSRLSHLFSPVSSWQPSRPSPLAACGSGVFPALLCRDLWERRQGSGEPQGPCRELKGPPSPLCPLLPRLPQAPALLERPGKHTCIPARRQLDEPPRPGTEK